MQDSFQNNKRIAKNTLLLYVRMLFAMIVGFYTMRIVLQTLGVVDFGLYGVIGGFVSLFSFLNASMSGCTSRFLSFELGKGDFETLHDTFCMALYVHICIALLVFALSEPLGIWFIENKMQIPQERMYAVKIVFHLSILAMMANIIQVPYNASIISHEKMNVYAYIEIVNVFLKLLIVYLLQIGNYDRLVLYSIFMLCVSVFIAYIYHEYCVRTYRECHLKRVWRKDIFKRILSFSCYDLYGNLSVTIRTNGVNMLLNMFFGPVMNAAASIAAQVQGATLAFVNSVTTAVRPQIIKQYAAGEYESMVSLIRNSVKLNCLIIMLVSIPLITELHFVLHIWLDIVPKYAVTLCTYTILFSFFGNLSYILVTGVHATGKIFRPSFINGSLYLAVIPVSYLSFKLEGEYWTPYLFNVLAVVLGLLSNAYTLQLYVKTFPLTTFILKDLLPCMVLYCADLWASYLITFCINEGWIRLFIICLLSSTIIMTVGLYGILPYKLRTKLIEKIRTKIQWKT